MYETQERGIQVTEPQYRQIAEKLRADIRAGKWAPGQRLPSHAELAALYNVSVTTTRGAVSELAKENLVFTATSRGTIVRNRQILDHVVTDSIRPDRPRRSSADVFVETAERAGRQAEKKFEMQIVPATPEVAGWLGIEPNSWVVARSLIQSLDGEPWSWEISHFPRDLAEATGIDSPQDIPGGTMQRLRERGYQETSFVHLEHARPASREEAERLAVPIGTWITDFVRIASTGERITRATRRRFAADRNRIIHELGDEQGLALIRNALNSANDSARAH
ncbi:GntR family transcriptional regulator [Prauserella marina]|uniref:GntR family transcriptional regulator n=1 Tax=Prauserella marina TaxID=530584 RepID=A0A1G6Z014_9PSEU|nr:GntR family transcriptional regulator [Prauserella marina]SDD95940.1 GntR family transcriptional regulator [Prauserella marina]